MASALLSPEANRRLELKRPVTPETSRVPLVDARTFLPRSMSLAAISAISVLSRKSAASNPGVTLESFNRNRMRCFRKQDRLPDQRNSIVARDGRRDER